MKARAKQWGELAVAHGVPLPALAIAFGLWPKAVSHVVCGMRTAAEVRQNIAVRHAAHLPCRARRSVKVTGLAKKLAFIGICSQNFGPT
jgi:aryl-alcohol dehydrogenase-like predicted oxidoreductase